MVFPSRLQFANLSKIVCIYDVIAATINDNSQQQEPKIRKRKGTTAIHRRSKIPSLIPSDVAKKSVTEASFLKRTHQKYAITNDEHEPGASGTRTRNSLQPQSASSISPLIGNSIKETQCFRRMAILQDATLCDDMPSGSLENPPYEAPARERRDGMHTKQPVTASTASIDVVHSIDKSDATREKKTTERNEPFQRLTDSKESRFSAPLTFLPPNDRPVQPTVRRRRKRAIKMMCTVSTQVRLHDAFIFIT